jgi:hypothetical protein
MRGGESGSTGQFASGVGLSAHFWPNDFGIVGLEAKASCQPVAEPKDFVHRAAGGHSVQREISPLRELLVNQCPHSRRGNRQLASVHRHLRSVTGTTTWGQPSFSMPRLLVGLSRF